MSTVSPERARRTAERIDQAGGTALDAPVSGGDVGARDGTLSIMVGGPEAAFERALPLLEALGRTVVHVGDTGAGQVVKACNQVVVALTIEAVAEALVLGSRCGVDPATISGCCPAAWRAAASWTSADRTCSSTASSRGSRSTCITRTSASR
jgi:2-hydroxy-3-oxopropionate reductase